MKISFLASHGGTAAKHIVTAIRKDELSTEVGVVITNNADSSFYYWCKNNDVAVIHISGKTHPNETEKDHAICTTLQNCNTDIIVLSGYMKKIGPYTLNQYDHRILNIHPSLLPRHGGKELYGDRVHHAVLASGDKESGATVRYINQEYDEGPIIIQQKVRIEPGETVESLKTKVQSIEGELFINAIKKIA